jgi:hypothetical protein
MRHTGKQHQKHSPKRQNTEALDERNHGRTHGCGSNNPIKATNPFGRVEYFHLEFQWRELHRKRELMDLTNDQPYKEFKVRQPKLAET